MVARCRASRFVRWALAAGALFSIGLTLGLHPEPHTGRPEAVFSAHSGPASSQEAPSGDGCVACRAQNAFAISDLGAPVPTLPSSVTNVALPRDAQERVLTRPSHEGRAPPSRA